MEEIIGFSNSCDHISCQVEIYLAKYSIIILTGVSIYMVSRKKPLSDGVMTVLSLLCLTPLFTGITGYILTTFNRMSFFPLYLGIAITVALLVILAMIKHFGKKIDRIIHRETKMDENNSKNQSINNL